LISNYNWGALEYKIMCAQSEQNRELTDETNSNSKWRTSFPQPALHNGWFLIYTSKDKWTEKYRRCKDDTKIDQAIAQEKERRLVLFDTAYRFKITFSIGCEGNRSNFHMAN